MKVIVVGAGVLGASVARSLAIAGEEVVLLEREGPGSGTSSTTFAWTNANRKPDPDYYRLSVAGMAEHAVMARELPGEPAYFHSGGLQWADDERAPALAANVARLEGLGHPVRWVGREEAEAIAGDLRVPESASSIAYFPAEGYVRPDRLVQNLLADAVRHGAVLSIAEVSSIGEEPGRASVTLVGGEVYTADRVVLATGRWTDELAAASGIDVPMVTGVEKGSPTVGLLGYVQAPRLDLRCVVHTPGLNLRPGVGTPTVVQALDLNPHVDPGNPPAADDQTVTTMVERLAALVRDPGQATEIDLRVGFRSLPADGHPIAGFTSDASRVYCLVSHGGITLAALLGRLVASEISTDHDEELLRAFRPTRFSGVSRSDIPALARPTGLGEQ